MSKSRKWSKLDNAAKIFPCTTDRRDTKVFRFACELTEPVDGALLQQAQDRALELFPFYRFVLKRGLFWYYFEESPLPAVVREEAIPPCSELYHKNVKSLLFRVTWYRRRINLEVFHALTDGTGALQFLRMIVYHYLLLRHPQTFKGHPPEIDYDASMSERSDDSFQKYYTGEKHKLVITPERAYRIKGSKVPEKRIQVIEGVLPVRPMLDLAHEYHTTLTGLVAAVFLCSIRDTVVLRDLKKPMVLSVPVNLRQYFPSESARNFFCVFDVGYHFDRQSGDLKDVATYITEQFQEELTKERMEARMNRFAAVEHNVFARGVPLFIKDFVLRMANRISDTGHTASLSNIGRVGMPEEMRPYISRFDVFVSTSKLQLCMCSFEDQLSISFSSAFEHTDVQRNFFRTLTKLGIPVTVATNMTEGNEEKR